MLLYAETTFMLQFKYSIFNDIVTKLNWLSKSAGNNTKGTEFVLKDNIVYRSIRTPETLRNESTVNKEEIKFISQHVTTHLKPRNDNELGYYLAGIIDGDGHFSTKQQLVLVFNLLDSSLAYYLKGKIGYGNVYKVKNKKAILLIVSNKKGLERIITIINGKIRTENKFNQITNNILNHDNYREFSKTVNLKLDLSSNFNNNWLAGFSDADASFQIKLLNRKNRTEIRLNYQIDQKRKDILVLIKQFIGGNIGYRKSQDTYYYGSTSFSSAKKVIKYFDHYHLLSSKYVNYIKWRKAYLIIQNKEHLTKKGIDKIAKLKNTMNSYNNITVI